jgi:hypothetical protein
VAAGEPEVSGGDERREHERAAVSASTATAATAGATSSRVTSRVFRAAVLQP